HAMRSIFGGMSVLDPIQDLSPEEIAETGQRLWHLPANAGNSMSLEEVVFWAVVSTGMDVSRSMQEDLLDGGSASKIEAYSSLLAYSTKNAVVDITLEQLEPSRVRE